MIERGLSEDSSIWVKSKNSKARREILLYLSFFCCACRRMGIGQGRIRCVAWKTHIQEKSKGNNRIQIKTNSSTQLFRSLFCYFGQYRTNVRVFHPQPVVLQIHACLPTGIHRLLFDDSLYTENPYLLFSFLLFLHLFFWYIGIFRPFFYIPKLWQPTEHRTTE